MEQYCIKAGYEHRSVNATFESEPGAYWNRRRLLLSHYAQYAVYELAADLIRERQLKTVLDIGCGLGHKLVRLICPLASVTAFDQATCVSKARELFPELDIRPIDLESGDAVCAGQFDLVMSVDVIEHLVDPDKLLALMKRCCHGQSLVLISTPERDIRRGLHCMKSKKAEHVREWNRSEFAAYLSSRGLEVIDHRLLPAFRCGLNPYMLKERWRLIRKGISLRYSQCAVCRVV